MLVESQGVWKDNLTAHPFFFMASLTSSHSQTFLVSDYFPKSEVRGPPNILGTHGGKEKAQCCANSLLVETRRAQLSFDSWTCFLK